MTETLTKTKREQAYDDWLEALRSGEYEQAQGFLCREFDDGIKGYCCVGVLDEAVFNTTWTPRHTSPQIFQDSEGNIHNLENDSPKAEILGLNEYITEDEVPLLLPYLPYAHAGTTRLGVLAGMNDNGVDFDTIAMVIEDVLDWRNK